jgi:hypothetical protein
VYLKETQGVRVVNWIYLAQDRKQRWVGPCEHNNEPFGFIKEEEFIF